ncbi:MAG: hypothetical protein AB2L07_16195 [Thermoanaerobaculaceae bacterium]
MLTKAHMLEVLLPVRDDSGHRYSTRSFSEVEELLVALCDGVTRRPDVTAAASTTAGTIAWKTCRCYTALLPTVGWDRLVSLINMSVGRHFRFEEIEVHVFEITEEAW